MNKLRVIYLTHPSRGVPAPELMVRFRCPVCKREAVIDAFLGVPVCQTDRKALEGITVVREPMSAVSSRELERRARRPAQ